MVNTRFFVNTQQDPMHELGFLSAITEHDGSCCVPPFLSSNTRDTSVPTDRV
jgi:hypothetical protein